MSTSSGAGARALRALLSLLVVAGAFAAAYYLPPKLGLDLSGGTQIVLEAKDGPDGTEANSENTDKVIEVLRERINSLGISEATMSRSGEDRIIVELPGIQDPSEAAELLGQTAQLTFHPVLGVKPSGAGGMPGVQAPPGGATGGQPSGGGAPADEARAPAQNNGGGEGSGSGGGEGSGGQEMSQEQLQKLLQQQQQGGGAGGAGGAGQPAANPEDVAKTLPDAQGQMLQLGKSQVKGGKVESAEATMDQYQSQWQVNVEFKGGGRDDWRKLTGEVACNDPGTPQRKVAIVLDDQVISSPQVDPSIKCDEGMSGGTTTITGQFKEEEAKELATLIEGGALPLPVQEIERRTVGPTLGEEAIDASFKAGIIGLALTAIYICLAYRLVGLLASVALAAYTLISYAVLVGLGATLTLPGLAGFVLAIGMAIDANVLIFERAREEHQRQQRVYTANKSAGLLDAETDDAEEKAETKATRRRRRAIPPNLHKAFLTGTQRAWSAVLDTNITTLIAAGLLFFLASGTVQGFGVTLGIGTLVSMFSALVIARILVEWTVRRKVVRNHPAISGISRISKVREWLITHNPDLMKRSTLWLGITGLITLVAVVGMVVRPPNFGVEFTGGRVMDFSTSESVSVSEARGLVADAGFPQAVVQESGDSGDITVRTGEISDDQAKDIEESLASGGGDAERTSDRLIGPSLGDELRNKAGAALLAALVLQMAYLAWRFRWSFGLATMLSLVFDIVVVIGLFCWLGKPIDGVFLAAILSVIGFSVNDSVVVFDRVRDEWARDDKSPFRKVANAAILHTLPRTVNSGIGGIFILASLALLGGSSLTNFSIAMLVGLVSGMLSTIFVGTPLAIWLNKFDKTAAPHVQKEQKAKQQKQMQTANRQDDGAVV